MRPNRFGPALPKTTPFTLGDSFILCGVAALLYVGHHLAFHAPAAISGPDVSLSPYLLPWYALLSVGRMAAAYLLSLCFSLFYGYAAARRRTARVVLMPLLDVLQSIPILSFLPVVLLSLTAIMPDYLAAELAAIILIFTSQAWNMTFSFYQSMTTIPGDLREAAAIFRFDGWTRFKTMELPFAAMGLLWNSMMSWSGGWFFLMAAEIFHIGSRDFRLPGLGSYLQTAASRGDTAAVLMGVATLISLILLLDQLVWRPLVVWCNKFKIEMLEGEGPPTSWFYDLLGRSWLVDFFGRRVWQPFLDRVDRLETSRPSAVIIAMPGEVSGQAAFSFPFLAALGSLAVAIFYGSWQAVSLLWGVPLPVWGEVFSGLFATFLRVCAALAVALLWTVPVGVAIGTNRRLARILQPMVQVVAAIPATALFPILLLALLATPGGLNIAAITLMLMGTQWYLLFNVIAGASAIPQDLLQTTALLRLPPAERWRTLILPALFPYIITGAITASGGAWNASIVAEYVEFGGRTHSVTGIGALIARATAGNDYALLLAATLLLVVTVVVINRIFWQKLYRLAEERYRLE
jgi:NitT/TauT family transport system permease protein